MLQALGCCGPQRQLLLIPAHTAPRRSTSSRVFLLLDNHFDVNPRRRKRSLRGEMGLPSMPSAAEAFFPVVLVANMLFPLVLLKEGIRWVVFQVLLGHEDSDTDQYGDVSLEPELESGATAPSEGERERRASGVRLSRFKSLPLGAGRNGCICCCCVCLHGFQGNQEVSQVLSCRHFFHRGCLDGWLDSMHTTCPLCRASVYREH